MMEGDLVLVYTESVPCDNDSAVNRAAKSAEKIFKAINPQVKCDWEIDEEAKEDGMYVVPCLYGGGNARFALLGYDCVHILNV